MTTSPPDWSFSGDTGPDAWATIRPEYARCASGRLQSPVDLGEAVEGGRGDLSLSYHLNRLTFVDLHWTLQVLADPGGHMSYGGRLHEFAEMHFHAPAEHSIDGIAADLEAHFVHQADGGQLAVVAVLFDVAPGTHDIDDLVAGVPAEPGGEERVAASRDIQRLIPLRSRRYRYTGSRTTPPCSENVSWIVMEDRGTVGADALTAFTRRYEPNARPTQPLNGRTITLG